jgi:hypothetical protein
MRSFQSTSPTSTAAMGLAALEMEPTEEEEFRSLIITNGRTSKALHGNDGGYEMVLCY